MNFIKQVLVKLGVGFLYGAGFMVAATLVGTYAFSQMQDGIEEKNQMAQERAEEYEEERNLRFREYDESANLIVEVSKERISNDEFTLIGKLKNEGDASWSSISLKAELFDENGDFIDECGEYITQNSDPESSLNFKLSCSDCSKLQLGEYHSYKLSVTSASYRH